MRVLLILFLFPIWGAHVWAGTIVPEHEIFTTKNGVEVYFFPSPNVPLFQVEMVFSEGAQSDPKEMSGLSYFAAQMMRKGIAGMDENAISRKMDDLAAGIDVSVGDENIGVSAFGLNTHAESIIDLMFRQLGGPTFPEKPFLRLKANHLDSLNQLSDSAPALASQVVTLTVFNGTEIALPVSGLKRDIQKFDVETIRKHYRRLFRTDGLKVAVIGGKDRAEIADKVIRGVEAMQCHSCGAPRPEPRKTSVEKWLVNKGSTILVKRPGISEAHVRMGFLGPKRQIPEYYDLLVAETILSGYFGSRMNLLIREKLNLTYGISAGFRFGWDLGSFSVSSSTRNAMVGRLITEVKKLLRDFVKKGATESELRMAKDYLIGSFPLGLQNRYVVATTYFNGRIHGLDSGFLDEYTERVNAVTLESLHAAVRKHMDLDEMITVVSGDARALSGALRKSGIKFIVRKPEDYL